MNPDNLAPVIAAIDAACKTNHRLLVAVVGPPASGKSTCSAALQARYGKRAAIVPMDGFHFDNTTLIERNIFEKKGAPETFDVVSFLQLVSQIADGLQPKYPIFDRENDCVITDAATIAADAAILIFEGNYLLLNAAIWHELSAFWGLSIWIDAPVDLLERRLIQRWINYGLSLEDATARAHTNDLVNVTTTLDKSILQPATIILKVE